MQCKSWIFSIINKMRVFFNSPKFLNLTAVGIVRTCIAFNYSLVCKD